MATTRRRSSLNKNVLQRFPDLWLHIKLIPRQLEQGWQVPSPTKSPCLLRSRRSIQPSSSRGRRFCVCLSPSDTSTWSKTRFSKNFLVFMLSKNWENVQSLHINSLMGPLQIYSILCAWSDLFYAPITQVIVRCLIVTTGRRYLQGFRLVNQAMSSFKCRFHGLKKYRGWPTLLHKRVLGQPTKQTKLGCSS